MSERGIYGAQTKEQGENELIDEWTLNVEEVGSAAGAITNEDMVLIRLSDEADVTATHCSGAMAVAGQIISLLAIGGNAVPPATPQSLTPGEQYLVKVIFDKDGHTDLSVIFKINCPKW